MNPYGRDPEGRYPEARIIFREFVRRGYLVDRVRLSPVVGDDRTRSAPERLGARLAGRVPVGLGTTSGDGKSAGSGRISAPTGARKGH